MALIEINTNPSKRDLNWFGGLFLLFFGIVGSIVFWRFEASGVAFVVWGGAAAIDFVYWLVPSFRRPLFVGWLYLFSPVGWVVSNVVLAVAFYLVTTPIGLVMRLGGRDPLKRRLDPEAETYWIERPAAAESSRYLKQF